MTDKPKPGAADTGTADTGTADTGTADTDAAAPDVGGVAAKRPSASAQAASRARRIGGRPTPGSRPKPTGQSSDSAPSAKPSPAKQAAGTMRAKEARDPAADSAISARRGGLRAARTAATERAVEAERPATGLTKRPTRKPGGAAAAREKQSSAAALRRRLDRIRWIPAGVLGAAVVVLAVACVVLGKGVWYGTKPASEIRGEVLSAAKTCTARVSSYDYRQLAQAKQDGQACATGKFRKDYTTAMETIVAKEAPKTKTAQSVQVAKAGIEQVSSDGRQWTLLIYGQHTVTNTTTGAKTPRLDKLSVRVTMDKVGNKWLISKLDLVAS